MRTRTAFTASALIYVALTIVLGRDVLSHLSTGAVHDTGDPLFTAALLYWNAWVLPLSERWWQFPVFYPTPDTMAFSEHLLGLSVIATPIAWLTRDPLVTANLVTLLTFPLSAAAMYLLVFRLTASAAGAFIAGLAFAFSPYRVSQLPHLQMLATFWAPLALVGLHAYLETNRRRWLALYGAAWLLQAAANGYFLVFLSVLVGFWVAWFVVALRRWRALGAIAVTTALACLPLVPILIRYVAVHARHEFERHTLEVQTFSADLGAVLCAPLELVAWGWLRHACRPEGELFPGLVLTALAVTGLAMVVGSGLAATRAPETGASEAGVNPWRRRVWWLAVTVVLLNIAAMVALAVTGPWRVDVLGLRVSASSFLKPVLMALGAGAVAIALSPRIVRALAQQATLAFYLVAALATWVLALGPSLIVGGQASPDGRLPFGWLMALPGASSIRAPARFWLLTTLCLAVVAGMVVARFFEAVTRRAPSRLATGGLCAALGVAVLSDGWIDRIRSVPIERSMPNPSLARGRVVLTLPVGDVRDIGPEFEGVTGGWTTVNGYSGYEPRYYPALVYGVRAELDELFHPFQAMTELDVVVPRDAPRLTALVERQPGVRVVAMSTSHVHYRLPKTMSLAVPRAVDSALPATAAPRRPQAVPLPTSLLALTSVMEQGVRRPIERIDAPCLPALAPLAIDGDLATRWYCGPQDGREVMTADLGAVVTVGAVRHLLGTYYADFPRDLVIETSADGVRWDAAWSGPTVSEVVLGALAEPTLAAAVFAFTPRDARFVRLHQVGTDDRMYWSVTELEVWSGSVQP